MNNEWGRGGSKFWKLPYFLTPLGRCSQTRFPLLLFVASWLIFHLISASLACHSVFKLVFYLKTFKEKKIRRLSHCPFCVLSLPWKLAFKMLMFGKSILGKWRTMKILNIWTKKKKKSVSSGELSVMAREHSTGMGSGLQNLGTNHCHLLFSFCCTGFPEYLAHKSNSCNVNYVRPLAFVVKCASP